MKERMFLVEGRKNVTEVLASNLKVEKLLGTDALGAYLTSNKLSMPFEKVSQQELESNGSYVSNDYALAVVRIPEPPTAIGAGPIILLDGVSDPGNLGTIARTMDWFGFQNLVCSNDCAEFYNPKTITSSMGSFCRIIPLYTDLVEYIRRFPDQNKYGLVLGGTPIASQLPSNGIYILGSESHGISPELRQALTHELSIQGNGKAESLNVAIAAGILLHQLSAS